jgi:hypothetical protein
MTRTDPELLPIYRCCPNCTMRMVTSGITASPEGFEYRTFECIKCGHGETKKMPVDPVAIRIADGWLKGELGRS